MSRSRIPFSESWDRPPLASPDGRPLIVQIVVNLELWRFDAALPRSLLPAPHGEPRIPDVPNYSWVEYGLRSGLPRIMRLFDSLAIPASASVNALLFEAEPAIGERVVEAGWELVGHGTEQRALAAGTERETVRATLDMLEEFSGSRPRGWLGPGLQETFDTPDVLVGAGIDYVLDWAVDDLPVWMDTRHGPLLAVPYSLEINDSLLFGVERHPSREIAVRVADTLKTFEQEAESEPRIVTLGLHPPPDRHPPSLHLPRAGAGVTNRPPGHGVHDRFGHLRLVPGGGTSRRESSMSVVKINAITVPDGMGGELEERFAKRAHQVERMEGFEGFELLRPVGGETRYFVYTRWRSEEDFQRWMSGQEFRRGHSQSDQAPKSRPVGTASELLSFEVVEHVT